ncbi:cyclin-U4-1-like [Diospyros lotus]|uniref:cyclin-U4-1-like n=1 Tax=Diospyros lotus TaxID=55363 RepID=UPI0022502B4A|nr:cyclin-U4-1-like [Diospyros lotus]
MAEFESVEATPRVINVMSSLLQRVAESNDLNFRFDSRKMTISAFHSLTRPTISVRRYLERIFRYANCSPSCFVVAYVYLDRFARRQPLLPINSFNVHRLLITSVLVSAKFMDDMYYNNAHYAKVGGISTVEMNLLEVDFLFGLGFQLNVTPDTFHTYCCYLHTEMLTASSLHVASSSAPLTIGRAPVLHCCSNEDESTHHQQLAV